MSIVAETVSHASNDQTAIEPKKPASRVRFTEMDALRGLAALWVMFYHYTWAFEHLVDGHTVDPWVMVPSGGLAVALFFMISGFVITMTIERQKSVVGFAWARFARLYPIYWAVIALNLAYFAVFPTTLCREHATSGSQVLANLTMLHPTIRLVDLDGNFWSLYVELMFYAVAGLCIAKEKRHWLTPIMLGVAALSVVAYAANFRDLIPGWWRIEQGIGLLKYGFLFALGIAFYEARFRRFTWLAPAIILAILNGLIRYSLEEFVVVVALAILLAAAISGRCRFLNNRLLVWFGTISYSLYLVHGNLGYIILRYGQQAGHNVNLCIAFASALSILVAAALTFTIERPAHNYLRKVAQRFPRFEGVAVRSSGAPTGAASL